MNTCKVCVVDDSFPNFKLDEKGICNYCKLHNEMENEIPNDERGSKILLKKVENIKKRNRKKNMMLLLVLVEVETQPTYYITLKKF